MSTVLTDVEQRIAALPPDEQAPRRELLERVTEAVMEKSIDDLAPLVDALTEGRVDADESSPWSLAEARKRNLERLLQDQARLIRQTIPASTVRVGLNVSRQRLHQLVAQGRLIAIQLQDGAPSLYPFWQFRQGMPVRPLDDLPRLIESAQQAGMDTVMLHFFMVEPNDRLEGRAPHELLAEGNLDRVIHVLTSSGG